MYKVAGRSCCELKSQRSHQNRNVHTPHGKVGSAPRRNVFKTGLHLARDTGITTADVARARARARAKNFAFFYANRGRYASCGARGAFGAARHLEGGRGQCTD